jgi:hypothetical protein
VDYLSDTWKAIFIKESLEALDGYWETVEIKKRLCETRELLSCLALA